jgi:hypothetical protein
MTVTVSFTAANRSSRFSAQRFFAAPASSRASPPTSAVSCGPSSLQPDGPRDLRTQRLGDRPPFELAPLRAG